MALDDDIAVDPTLSERYFAPNSPTKETRQLLRTPNLIDALALVDGDGVHSPPKPAATALGPSQAQAQAHAGGGAGNAAAPPMSTAATPAAAARPVVLGSAAHPVIGYAHAHSHAHAHAHAHGAASPPSARPPTQPPAAAAAAVPRAPYNASESRSTNARAAVPEDPDIRPFGCNSPVCLPSPQLSERLRGEYERDLVVWRAEHARLQANPATAGQRPAMKHPSLRSSGVSFASSKELLDHLKEVHAMKHNGEVPSIPPPVHPNDPRASLYTSVQGEDGKMFRCALVACQRTWKNANGLQYHTVTTLTAEEHNIDAVNRRRAPVKRKAEGSPGRDDPEDSIHYCPYKEQLGCTRHYKHIGGVRHHLQQNHRNEPDCREKLNMLPPAAIYNKKPKVIMSAPVAPLLPPPGGAHATAAAQRPALSAAENRGPPNPASSIPPYSGMFSHGYVFSGNSLPFRPRHRPIDALYYLNVLCSAGSKTAQQRASERLITNALLSANVIRDVQTRANDEAEQQGTARLSLFDRYGVVEAPQRPVREDGSRGLPFDRQDLDSAIWKLAGTLSQFGFGDALADIKLE